MAHVRAHMLRVEKRNESQQANVARRKQLSAVANWLWANLQL